ncbi:MAG: GGDEF domain-containing protein [Lachnospiraceae bacterium]|nr:GGDEF domain-containing protein [Lachnospiraceae bacterium]
MGFNVEEYAQALDKFIIYMEKIPDIINPDTQVAMDSLCRVLRIARVEADFYENLGYEEDKWAGRAVFYHNGECDPKRSIVCEEWTEEGNLMRYAISPGQEEPDWDETEREKIQVFLKALLTFNGRTRMQQVVQRLNFRDQELGMYNMAWFMKSANQIISQREIGQYAGCQFNMRHFSVINQQIGRERGSRVLGKFIRQFQELLSDKELVCRISGDNFISLFRKNKLNLVMNYLRGSGIVYDEKEGKRVWVTTNAGYYMIPSNCDSAATIVECLGVAINMARNVRKTDYAFFDAELMQGIRIGKMIEANMPEALEKEEFHVYYQPKIQLKDYHLVGAEALCRWFRNGKVVAPGEFIPILEKSKLICKLDFYMLEHVCRDIRRWLDEGKEVVKVSVNLSRVHMGDMDLLDNILAVVDKYQVPHEYIEIELTETGTDVGVEHLRTLVSGLRSQGISTSVDDFGTGYSSMNLIREIPWNVLKIDKSFLPDKSDDDRQKRVMFRHLVALAQDMDIECIVEGVENVDQIKLLKESSCYLAQGFYFDRPLAVTEFEKKLAEIRS